MQQLQSNLRFVSYSTREERNKISFHMVQQKTVWAFFVVLHASEKEKEKQQMQKCKNNLFSCSSYLLFCPQPPPPSPCLCLLLLLWSWPHGEHGKLPDGQALGAEGTVIEEQQWRTDRQGEWAEFPSRIIANLQKKDNSASSSFCWQPCLYGSEHWARETDRRGERERAIMTHSAWHKRRERESAIQSFFCKWARGKSPRRLPGTIILLLLQKTHTQTPCTHSTHRQLHAQILSMVMGGPIFPPSPHVMLSFYRQ